MLEVLRRLILQIDALKRSAAFYQCTIYISFTVCVHMSTRRRSEAKKQKRCIQVWLEAQHT